MARPGNRIAPRGLSAAASTAVTLAAPTVPTALRKLGLLLRGQDRADSGVHLAMPRRSLSHRLKHDGSDLRGLSRSKAEPFGHVFKATVDPAGSDRLEFLSLSRRQYVVDESVGLLHQGSKRLSSFGASRLVAELLAPLSRGLEDGADLFALVLTQVELAQGAVNHSGAMTPTMVATPAFMVAACRVVTSSPTLRPRLCGHEGGAG
jgi:hypothetical protein